MDDMEKSYDRALEEFYTEHEDQHRLVYSYFGLSIYQVQCLEEAFSQMLWVDRIFKKKATSLEEINEIIDNYETSKKTMGNFLNEVKQSYELPDVLKDKLDDLLQRRNYLVHKYFKLHIEKFYSEIGQLEMIKFFCDFVDEARAADQALKSYYSIYTDKLGLTEEKIEQLMEEMKQEELKRVANHEQGHAK